MTIFWIKTLQLLLALSILIVIHELGHFLFAKLFKIKVDKFFLFFDAYGFKLLSSKSGWFSKLFPKLKNCETEYGIGWLPLGGYCKICGMVDESMDKESLAKEPEDWEFRSKPAWQRFWVMFGGVLFNFLLAFVIFIFILNVWGQSYISNKNTPIYVNTTAYNLGFRNGDKILNLDGRKVQDFAQIQAYLVRNHVKEVTVLRNNDSIQIPIKSEDIAKILNSPAMFLPATEAIIDSVPEDSKNYVNPVKEKETAPTQGLENGDRILAIDNQPVTFAQDLHKELSKYKSAYLNITIERAGKKLNTKVYVDSNSRLNIYLKQPEIATKQYSLLSSIPAGIKMTYKSISSYIGDLKLVAQPSTGAYKSVGSFISIGRIFPATWHLYSFLYICAMLSIMLGVMNLLPIPALDGGHIVFLLYEIIFRKKPSEKFLMRAQIIGMILLIALAFLACGNDIIKLIH